MVGYSQINRHFEVAEIEEHFRYRCRTSEAEAIHSLGAIQPRPSLAIHWRQRPRSQPRQIVRRLRLGQPRRPAARGARESPSLRVRVTQAGPAGWQV
jgi:hypothetical protein